MLKSSNGTWYRKSTVMLSTIKLPFTELGSYESCLFTNDGTEVIDRYDTLQDAIVGHENLRKAYGLK